jgi:hypothetical protein
MVPTLPIPNAKRTPIILSSDGREADAANLIHDYNIDITKNEEKAVDVIVFTFSDRNSEQGFDLGSSK